MRRKLIVALAGLALVASCASCSPVYVMKAGLAQMRIMRAAEPIHRVMSDSTTDADTRAKLRFVLEARQFAAEELGIDVGESYTTYAELESDTLALVLSGAPKDALRPVTWWFPVVGHVPYKGFFSEDDALEAQAELAREGYDTYLRPTAAFSTLGWFNDPLMSSVLQGDHIEVVETVLHELAHQYLFVPGHVGFNESFATFVGRVGAIRFFCEREGGGPDTVWCLRTQARWRDYQRFSVFIDTMVDELEALYGASDVSLEEKVERREEIFARALEVFDREVQPTLEAFTFAGFRETPLNNATLLGRIRYFHRLPDFAAYLEARDGDLVAALRDLRDGASDVDDPFELLPMGSTPMEAVAAPLR